MPSARTIERGFHISETTDYHREHDVAEDLEIDEKLVESPIGDFERCTPRYRSDGATYREDRAFTWRFAVAVANMIDLKDAKMFAHL